MLNDADFLIDILIDIRYKLRRFSPPHDASLWGVS